MWNGFYNVSLLDAAKLKEFYLEALEVSDDSCVQTIPSGSWTRQNSDMSPIDYINNILGTHTHNIAVDRFTYNGFADFRNMDGEVGSSTMSGGSYYLYLNMSVEKFNILIEKWGLTKKEI